MDDDGQDMATRSSGDHRPHRRVAGKSERVALLQLCGAHIWMSWHGEALDQSDIDIRIVNEGRVPLAPLVRVHELREAGAVIADDNVKVTATLVITHRSYRPSPVHLEEQSGHALERRRSPRIDRRTQAGRPREPDEIAVVGSVIGMLVRDEDVAQRCQRHTRKGHLPGDAIAAVDHIGGAIADDHLRGSGIRRSGSRPTSCSE